MNELFVFLFLIIFEFLCSVFYGLSDLLSGLIKLISSSLCSIRSLICKIISGVSISGAGRTCPSRMPVCWA